MGGVGVVFQLGERYVKIVTGSDRPGDDVAEAVADLIQSKRGFDVGAVEGSLDDVTLVNLDDDFGADGGDNAEDHNRKDHFKKGKGVWPFCHPLHQNALDAYINPPTLQLKARSTMVLFNSLALLLLVRVAVIALMLVVWLTSSGEKLNVMLCEAA